MSHDEEGVEVAADCEGSGAARCDTTCLVRRVVLSAWFLGMFIAALFYTWKVADDRTAFIRWRHQVHELGQGKNIWDSYYFPNPPIVPILMAPMMALPPLAGALAWFALKVALVTIAMRLCCRMAQGDGMAFPWWAQGVVMLLSLRPILSDLHHGNNNIIILFLVICTLTAWRRGHDILAGLALGLAITYKVTPALLLPYFLYKGSWKTVAATLAGIVIFLLVVPSVILGPEFNLQCLAAWWHNILSPYLVKDVESLQEVNQSMVAALSRLITEARDQDPHGYGAAALKLNILSLPMRQASIIGKCVSAGMVCLLAVLCRTNTRRRDDARLLGEFSLVVLTMLFVSERSWKHHFVTMVLPYTYLVYKAFIAPASQRVRGVLATALGVSALLMISTSKEVGSLFANEKGHIIAQFYGMFFWSAFVLYVATAWRVLAEKHKSTGAGSEPASWTRMRILPTPHLAPRPKSRFPVRS